MPKKVTPRPDREPLLKLGMTEQELEIWDALADAAGKMLNLPLLHPIERHEVVHDFHKLQLRLLARPGLRAAGWPKKEEE